MHELGFQQSLAVIPERTSLAHHRGPWHETISASRQQESEMILAADNDIADQVFSGKDDPDDHVIRFE
ncbi:MAG TPA: hypothetical protein DEF45_23585 [Rhodopirellula sp.]|nr:MAG: hypothetical protein CBD74_02790 [Saprospirales bacterium TMED214]HBV65995.1 hypothetical protein [Rhodopirellula sp.]